ncbi:MAG: hypothetical protein COW84_04390 [Gammaproteobacteria bacterium CG22_combo_CG10-13_8_21_14_all_40_8]|nr:MAG: hypothetical protein COW84_04390 [Gammaproteobacteria bacterium CG22_combo_CG10-13_8_21_14_all_40_8]
MKNLMLFSVLFLSSNLVQAVELDKTASSIHFISIKKDAIGEIHRFKNFELQVQADGKFKLDIDLKTVDTSVAIRDQRLRDLLFETIRFPMASISGEVNPSIYRVLKAGDTLSNQVAAEIYLHGMKQTLTIAVQITKLSDNSLRIDAEPFILDAKLFGFSNGIDSLAKIAGLNAISSAIPVFFSLKLHL